MATDGLQTWVLKVYIHCEGCKKEVKKVLKSIEGVSSITVEAAEQKVTVTGQVESKILIKALGKAGKQAELWSQEIDKQQKKVKFEAAEPPKEGCDQGERKGKAAKDSHKKSKGGKKPSTSTGGGGEEKSSALKEEGGGEGKSSGKESDGGASSGDETTTTGGGTAAEVLSGSGGGGGVVAGMSRYVPETMLVVDRNAATMSGSTAMVYGAYPIHYNHNNPIVVSNYAEEGEAESRHGIDDPTYLFNDENANNCCIM